MSSAGCAGARLGMIGLWRQSLDAGEARYERI